jgi:hypothetical protein
MTHVTMVNAVALREDCMNRLLELCDRRRGAVERAIYARGAPHSTDFERVHKIVLATMTAHLLANAPEVC